MDTVTVIRSFYLMGAGLGILFDTVPFLQRRYVAYGTRTPMPVPTPEKTAPTASIASKNSSSTDAQSSPGTISWFDVFAHPVPHSWFTHYYALSLTLSLFWLWQLLTRGPAVRWLASHATQDASSSMTIERVYLAWTLLTLQGYRRLHESLTNLKPSTSRSTMPVSIYLIGLAFYLFNSVAVWIEGSATLLALEPISWTRFVQHAAAWRPSLRTFVFLPLFIVASGIQTDCHAYLASLPKYTLPEHPIFQRLLAPHYSMECLIYVSFALLLAPKGEAVNGTMLCAVVWVVVNLGITAKGARRWSIGRFGKEKVGGRWCMVPWVW